MTTRRNIENTLWKRGRRVCFSFFFRQCVNMYGWCGEEERMAQHESAYVNRKMIEVITRERWHKTRPSITSHQNFDVSRWEVSGIFGENNKRRKSLSGSLSGRTGGESQENPISWSGNLSPRTRRSWAAPTPPKNSAVAASSVDNKASQQTLSIFFPHRIRL